MACVGARGSVSFLPTDCSRLRRPQEWTLSPPPSLSFPSSGSRTRSRIARMATLPTLKAEVVSIEKSGIKIVRSPPEPKLSELGVRSWPKWGCPPSKFPWTYSAKETCFLLEGQVKVYPDGSEEPVEIAAGDLVEFPKGMSCTWDVSVGVDKHYRFD
uniref:(S)-ureidoglycine aminohydrolase cupin domain-containing protein n=1 Tax=Rhizophora mucronata TaxID=61149 RepID=A0A2P2IMG9_RHIMU